jgi:hypothetical protein
MQQQRGGSLAGLPGAGYPPPLEKARVDAMLPGFLLKKNVKIEQSMLTLNDQQIDLAHLHALVISEGGFQKVSVVTPPLLILVWC